MTTLELCKHFVTPLFYDPHPREVSRKFGQANAAFCLLDKADRVMSNCDPTDWLRKKIPTYHLCAFLYKKEGQVFCYSQHN